MIKDLKVFKKRRSLKFKKKERKKKKSGGEMYQTETSEQSKYFQKQMCPGVQNQAVCG